MNPQNVEIICTTVGTLGGLAFIAFLVWVLNR